MQKNQIKRKCWTEFLKKFPQPECGMEDQEKQSMIDEAFEIGFKLAMDIQNYGKRKPK